MSSKYTVIFFFHEHIQFSSAASSAGAGHSVKEVT